MDIPKYYIDNLKDRVFKVLPLMEECNDGVSSYIDSLIYEVYGLYYIVNEKEQSVIVTLLSILEHFYDDSIQPELDLVQIRREVFHCLTLIDKHFKGDSDELR